jgi:hypothetical protein
VLTLLHMQVSKCSLVETAFLLLVTVSTVNLLTTVLNDAPVLRDEEDGGQQVRSRDRHEEHEGRS